jgi:hypothetical protein
MKIREVLQQKGVPLAPVFTPKQELEMRESQERLERRLAGGGRQEERPIPFGRPHDPLDEAKPYVNPYAHTLKKD